MPRISSTSCITGTGFMKWKPMNFSGRSVRLASRVIEIDEVFEVRIVVRPQMRQQVLEDRLLDGLALGRGLDHQVGLAEIGQLQRGADPRQRGVPVACGDLLARDLAVEVLFDQGDRAVQRFLADVGHQNVVAGQRGHMGDAVAHLTGPDHPDCLNIHPRAPSSMFADPVPRPATQARGALRRLSRRV
jgi:hypothetical protein